MGDQPTRVLFVCLGNICRSPLAEGVFAHLAKERGVIDRFYVDSAGTGGWHSGEAPDPRMTKVAKKRGVALTSVARKVEPRRDFPDADGEGGFDVVVAMDQENLEALLKAGCPSDRLSLLRSHDPAMEGKSGAALEVPDPYYGGADGFEEVYDLVLAACQGLLDGLAPGSRLPDPPAEEAESDEAG
jgi:protein-tyrosine phosphatase